MSKAPANVASFSHTFKYLLATQFLSRGIPFIFNSWIVRHLTAEDYALYAVQFHLFVTCVLFLSREGFRRACMRADIKCDDASTEEYAAKLLKVAWMTLPLGVVTTISGCAFVFWWQGLTHSDPYAQAILINGCACILELLAEPLYILSQNLLLLKLRLIIETAATLLRCLTIPLLVFLKFVESGSMDIGVTLFFSGHLEVLIFFPFRLGTIMDYDKQLSSMYTPYNQAVYGLVDKLGSLVVRLVFLPFEESSYATFARSASGKDPDKSRKLRSCLSEALKLVFLIGAVFMSFGPSYSYSLIRMLYGRKWSDGEASTALQYYCLYVILLAMNGTSEAFLHAVATESQLKRSNDSLLVFSLIYVVMNVLLIKSAGAIGLILANSLNMILRILYSAVFIKHYFQDSSAFSFASCLPSGWTVLLFSGVITLISEKLFLDHENFWPTFLIHFSIGVTCFCISSFVIYRRERPFINKIIRFRDHME
ncbi:hypothetical protein OIU77_023206 [Salix suchowensis]|uniref:Protein RFT1 homolog n=1 Tax=Salix suchowensis TaxID=1278906 RepID=A0ABQ9C310_9ROSI|nr:hypothetical protein OIU77_023206 [Salix suchowensis]